MAWSISAINNDFPQQAITQVQHVARAQAPVAAAHDGLHNTAPSVVVPERVSSMAATMATAPVAAATQAARASNQAVSVTQTAAAGLQQVETQLTRMRELAVQAYPTPDTASSWQAVDAAYQTATRQVQRVTQGTAYNGIALLNGSQGTFGAHPREVMLPDVAAACECIMGTRLNCQWATSRALMAIDQAIANVGLLRTQLHGSLVTLEHANVRSLIQQLDLSGAGPYTADSAYAIATNALASARAQEQAAHVVAVIANQMPTAALALLYFNGAASGGR